MLNLKHLRKYPCPRCKTPAERIHLLGSVMDRRNRLNLRRYDSNTTQTAISEARKKILIDNHPVNSVHVKRKLNDPTLVPIMVSASVLNTGMFTGFRAEANLH